MRRVRYGAGEQKPEKQEILWVFYLCQAPAAKPEAQSRKNLQKAGRRG